MVPVQKELMVEPNFFAAIWYNKKKMQYLSTGIQTDQNFSGASWATKKNFFSSPGQNLGAQNSRQEFEPIKTGD